MTRKNRKPHKYTEAQLTFLRLECELPRRELTEAFNARFGTDLPVGMIKRVCQANGWKTGRTGCFEKGSTPWNTGKSFQAGGRSAETRFKPGSKPANWCPIGHERWCGDYLQRKVTDTGYTPGDYVEVHRLLWEEHNGPIPASHVVIFKDGDSANITIDNLMMISRGEHAVINKMGLSQVAPELKDQVVALAQVQMKRRERIKTAREHS